MIYIKEYKFSVIDISRSVFKQVDIKSFHDNFCLTKYTEKR